MEMIKGAFQRPCYRGLRGRFSPRISQPQCPPQLCFLGVHRSRTHMCFVPGITLGSVCVRRRPNCFNLIHQMNFMGSTDLEAHTALSVVFSCIFVSLHFISFHVHVHFILCHLDSFGGETGLEFFFCRAGRSLPAGEGRSRRSNEPHKLCPSPHCGASCWVCQDCFVSLAVRCCCCCVQVYWSLPGSTP